MVAQGSIRSAIHGSGPSGGGGSSRRFGLTVAEMGHFAGGFGIRSETFQTDLSAPDSPTDATEIVQAYDAGVEGRHFTGGANRPHYNAAHASLAGNPDVIGSGQTEVTIPNTTTVFREPMETGQFALAMRFRMPGLEDATTAPNMIGTAGNAFAKGWRMFANGSPFTLRFDAIYQPFNTEYLYRLSTDISGLDTAAPHTLLIWGDGTTAHMELDGSEVDTASISTGSVSQSNGDIAIRPWHDTGGGETYESEIIALGYITDQALRSELTWWAEGGDWSS